MGYHPAAAARVRRRGTHAALALILAGAFGPAACAAAPPARVASLNLCTDAMLFELLPDARIASVTRQSRNPNVSPFHRRAMHVASNAGNAEELLAVAPDLVVAGPDALLAGRLLAALGVDVVRYPHANDFPTYRSNLRDLAARLGVPGRAERALTALDLALAARAPRGAGPTALVYQPNGYSPGRATLMHALLEAAGLRNLAATRRSADGGYLGLEDLLLARPALLIFSARRDAGRSLAQGQLEHPALQRWLDGRAGPRPRRVAVPERWWTCAGRHNLRALARLREAT